MRLNLVLALALVSLLACGGRQDDAVGGEGILLGDGASLMGEAEDRARGFLLDMAFVLEANMEQPDQAVERMRALFAVNGEPMRLNVEELRARLEGLEGAERRLYEAQFAAHLDEANAAWRLQSNAFVQRWPDHGHELMRLVNAFDQ